MAYLECRELTRRPWFERRSLSLERGEALVLTGPTGSGKSLFLRTLADLDPADDDGAVVELDGRSRDAYSPTEWRRRVLLLQQSAPVLAGTVRENLERIAALHPGLDLDRSDPLGSLALNPAADAERLSGGEAQLLAFARAFLLAPDVYLLDEATSALDERTNTGVEDELRRRLKDGAAILWVTHDARIAERIGARTEQFP